MKIEVPKFFNLSHIEDFIADISPYLRKTDEPIKGVLLDVSKVKEICLLGQLLLYKFISYTADNKCFLSPKIQGISNPVLREQLGKSGFWELIDTYVKRPNDKKAIIKSYNNLKIVDEADFLIAPQKLLRTDCLNEKKIESMYLSKIQEFYGNTYRAHTIAFCIAELFSNFWSHATQDSGTVMVAKGNKDFIEICCADTGEGIISSLRNANAIYKTLPGSVIMKKALEKNVTSKPNTNHLGMGLYMINCVVLNGKNNIFKIFSDMEEYYFTSKAKEIFRSISSIGGWKGTVTYLRLDIKELLSLDKIDELRTPSYYKLQWS
ncbi:MAG: hypothetical protein VZQ47_05520 [Treponema sp.]|nr:hypothetical protein [Treponema sp.]MEE3434993.1 hypothetical protein [Treponema sp.]